MVPAETGKPEKGSEVWKRSIGRLNQELWGVCTPKPRRLCRPGPWLERVSQDKTVLPGCHSGRVGTDLEDQLVTVLDGRLPVRTDAGPLARPEGQDRLWMLLARAATNPWRALLPTPRVSVPAFQHESLLRSHWREIDGALLRSYIRPDVTERVVRALEVEKRDVRLRARRRCEEQRAKDARDRNFGKCHAVPTVRPTEGGTQEVAQSARVAAHPCHTA
jgi:hypothetical protein